MEKSIDIINKYADKPVTAEQQNELEIIYSTIAVYFNMQLTANQVSALTSFAFDVGLSTLFEESSIAYYLLNNNLIAAKREIRTFNKHGRMASAKLTARREDEIKLLCEG